MAIYGTDEIKSFAQSVKWVQGGMEIAKEVYTMAKEDCNESFGLLGITKTTVSGKRVLDIACNSGFYTFKAHSLGAAEVIGLDSLDWIFVSEKIKNIKRVNGGMNYQDKVKFFISNLSKEEWGELGMFDVIFMHQGLYNTPGNYLELLDLVAEKCSDLFACQTELLTHWNKNSAELGAEHRDKFALTYEILTFELLQRGFNFFKYKTLDGSDIHDLGIGISLKEKISLPQKGKRIVVMASKKTRLSS